MAIPPKDRLQSQVLVSRARRDEYTAASIINFESLRDSEDDSEIPSIIGDLFYQKRLFPAGRGRITPDRKCP